MYLSCKKKPYDFLTIDNTLPSGNPLNYRKNLMDKASINI